MKKILLLVSLILLSSQCWALVGVPCDPVKDFEKVYLIRNWQKMPHKNQEETLARVNEVNAKLPEDEEWTYNPEPNMPIYGCLSYGAAGMADWWAIELNRSLGRYRSFNNGRMERGYDPRKLELRYRKKGKWNKLHYTCLSSCPITGWSVPIRPKGYARLLVEDDSDQIMDPIEGTVYKYNKNDYPMEGRWEAVVSKHWFREDDKKLMRAIRNHGPLLIQFEIPKQKFLMGTHSVVVIGYGKLKNGRIAYICHDSFGDFPADYEQDAAGAPAYRYVLAEEIDEAIVFPHTPTAKAYRIMSGIIVKFYNRGGRPIHVRRAFLWNGREAVKMNKIGGHMAMHMPFATDQHLVYIYVEADYYMNTNNKGYWLKVRINNKRM
jgi:hypothetical protein